jgi:hypothetical protein
LYLALEIPFKTKPPGRSAQMDNWTFGITMTVVGMGGTLLSLYILSLFMSLLKKIFPLREENGGKAD